MINLKLEKIVKPLTHKNGFCYKEDFDGIWNYNNKTFYLNLKFICGEGGSQTRSLREVYHFILTQYNYLLKNKENNIYFVNIIDGDLGYKYIYDNFKKGRASIYDIKYNVLYKNIIDKIYIGDMHNFFLWYYNLIIEDNI
jgi:hypothetical protein